MNLLQNTVLNSLGWTLMHFLWQGVFVAVAFAGLTIPLKRCSAHSRYLVACGVFVCMAFCPLVTWISLQPDDSLTIVRSTESNRLEFLDGSSPSLSSAILLPTPDLSTDTSPNPIAFDKSLASKPVPIYWTPPGWPSTWNKSVESVFPFAVIAWLCGVLSLSFRMLLGWSYIERLRLNASTPISPLWMDRLKNLTMQMCVRRPVQLVESAMVEVPTVIGWLKPMI